MSLFWDAVRNVKSGAIVQQSTMSLFWEQLIDGTLDQSTMSLFWELMKSIGVDQSTMSLFWEQMKSLDLDQSTMSLFWDQLNFLYVTQSTMSLFWEYVLALEQSTMSLFGDRLASLDQSTMSLFDSGGIFDDFGHGTMVAGLIHVTAPEAALVPVKAFDSTGESTLFLAIAGVYAAIQLDVDVINMSFSIGGDSDAFERALSLAWNEGIALVASVGNDAKDAKDVYPAAYPTVIAVAATDFDDHLASFSNYGKQVTVTAPGQGVVSTFPGGLWAKASGTSFSAPIVTGSVALLVSLGRRSGTAAKTVVGTADSIDKLNPDFKRQLGRGRINVLKALRSISDQHGNFFSRCQPDRKVRTNRHPGPRYTLGCFRGAESHPKADDRHRTPRCVPFGYCLEGVVCNRAPRPGIRPFGVATTLPCGPDRPVRGRERTTRICFDQHGIGRYTMGPRADRATDLCRAGAARGGAASSEKCGVGNGTDSGNSASP